MLRQFEIDGDYTQRLFFLEELKGLPSGAVWDYFCLQQEAPLGRAVMDEILAYQKVELAQRNRSFRTGLPHGLTKS